MVHVFDIQVWCLPLFNEKEFAAIFYLHEIKWIPYYPYRSTRCLGKRQGRGYIIFRKQGATVKKHYINMI